MPLPGALFSWLVGRCCEFLSFGKGPAYAPFQLSGVCLPNVVTVRPERTHRHTLYRDDVHTSVVHTQCTHAYLVHTSCTQAILPTAPEQGPEHTPLRRGAISETRKPGQKGKETCERSQGRQWKGQSQGLSSHIPGAALSYSAALFYGFHLCPSLPLNFHDLQSKTSNFTVTWASKHCFSRW